MYYDINVETLSGFRNVRIGGHGRRLWQVIILHTLARHVGGGVSTHVRNEKNGNLEIALHTHTHIARRI